MADGGWILTGFGVALVCAGLVTRDREMRNMLFASAAGFFMVDIFVTIEGWVR